MRVRVLAALVVATASIAGGDAAAATSAVRWFHSPSGNIQCEVASHDARGTYAYCQTLTPLQTARLSPGGRTVVCAHRACAVGDGPENATTLAHGRSIRVGSFRCTSAPTGIRCVVVATGRGFRIARTGVTRF